MPDLREQVARAISLSQKVPTLTGQVDAVMAVFAEHERLLRERIEALQANRRRLARSAREVGADKEALAHEAVVLALDDVLAVVDPDWRCPRCDGTGREPSKEHTTRAPCWACNGAGSKP